MAVLLLLALGYAPEAVPRGSFRFRNDDATGAFSMSGTAKTAGELVLRLPARAGLAAITGGRLVSDSGGDPHVLQIALDGGAYSITAAGTSTSLPTGCAS